MMGVAMVLILSTFATKTVFIAADIINGNELINGNGNGNSKTRYPTLMNRIDMGEGGGVGKGGGGCKGSICNMLVLPCKSGCYCIPFGILPIGVCAGICCSSYIKFNILFKFIICAFNEIILVETMSF
ncbi:hypothetical protein PRUPE_2G216100 [Prunus persica]|uniref:Uncharacterized protein n=1 Tax=Prunus persica TaxID=3760 RepID=A0A251QJE5_PRUPE|nr:hypothetical protein PRUPE_2G216100 [Prunus persica]